MVDVHLPRSNVLGAEWSHSNKPPPFLVLCISCEWSAMRFNYKPRNALALEQHRDAIASSSESLEYIAAGLSGVVYGIDNERVLKKYDDSDEDDVERQVYEHLGSHPYIAQYLGSREDGSIVLERGRLLRTICQQSEKDQIPFQGKLRWLRHAAKGLRHVHVNEIIHADVGTQNMILTKGDRLKIIDFQGASIDGREAGSRYEWFSYRPSIPKISKQTDIFAFGCATYEIITGRPPYHELGKAADRGRLVEQLYENNQFPDVKHLPLGEFIQSCWDATFTSMTEIVLALEVASLKEKFRAAVASLKWKR